MILWIVEVYSQVNQYNITLIKYLQRYLTVQV